MNSRVRESIASLKAKLVKDKLFLLILMSIAYFVIYLIANTSNPDYYGYFNDELYFLDCTKHLAFGYVDQPPFSIFLLFLWTKLFGPSLFSIRFLAIGISAAIIFTTTRITAKLGGRLFSQVMASVSVMAIFSFMDISGYYSMNVVEILICNICVFLVIKMIRENKPTLWIVIGMLAGIGLLNKHTFIIYVASIVVGLLLTKERRFLFTVWFPAGLLIAFSIFLPNLIWQAANGWPSLAFYMNAHGKPDQSTLFNFTVNLIYIFNPVLFPFWLSGIIYLFFKNQGCCFRVFGWASVFLLLLLFVMREGRFDRALSIFPIILSSGMILLERLSTKKSFLFLRPIIAALVVLSGLYYVPIIMPVLRPEAAAKYLDKFGYKFVGFVGAGGRLAYPLAAKTGWEELVRRIADIYRSLPENEKKNTGIFGPLFGYPGAVDLLGGKYGLPMAISGHSSYYYWGIEECRNYDVVIVVLGSVFDGYFSRFFFEDFAEVDRLGPFYNDYWPDFLRSNSIYVFKQPNVQFKTVWEKYKL